MGRQGRSVKVQGFCCGKRLQSECAGGGFAGGSYGGKDSSSAKKMILPIHVRCEQARPRRAFGGGSGRWGSARLSNSFHCGLGTAWGSYKLSCFLLHTCVCMSYSLESRSPLVLLLSVSVLLLYHTCACMQTGISANHRCACMLFFCAIFILVHVS